MGMKDQSDYKRVGGRRWPCAPCWKVLEALGREEVDCEGKSREVIERQARVFQASSSFFRELVHSCLCSLSSEEAALLPNENVSEKR